MNHVLKIILLLNKTLNQSEQKKIIQQVESQLGQLQIMCNSNKGREMIDRDSLVGIRRLRKINRHTFKGSECYSCYVRPLNTVNTK